MDDVKTLATLILGGIFDQTELSDNDIEVDSKLAEELQQKLVATIDDVHIELVARSDFDAQRLRADTAEAERDTERKFRESAEGGWREANRVIAMQRERLDADEQRIAELLVMLRQAWVDTEVSAADCRKIDAALNPKPEAGSHE